LADGYGRGSEARVVLASQERKFDRRKHGEKKRLTFASQIPKVTLFFRCMQFQEAMKGHTPSGDGVLLFFAIAFSNLRRENYG
jgi:hypothetical protein